MGAAIYLFANLFRWPDIPYLLGGDQVFFWTDAQRMLHGERIYQDFFRFTPPGVDLVFVTAFKVFGPRLWVTNAIVLVLGIALCWMCFSIARQLMDQTRAALAAVLFLVLIYGSLLNATHHWFSLLAVMGAARLLMASRAAGALAIAGGLLGVASFFTQTAGVLCLVAVLVFLTLELRASGQPWQIAAQRGLLPVAAFGVATTVLYLPYLARAGWKAIWEMLVVYPRYLTYGIGKYFPGLPDALTVHKLPRLAPTLVVYALLPTIYPLALWRMWGRRERTEPKLRWAVTLLSLMGLALLLEILPAVSWLRVYAIAMPGIILLVWAFSQRSRIGKYLSVMVWLLVILFAAAQIWSRQRTDSRVVALPAGDAVLPAPKSEQYLWFVSHTHPGDRAFAATWPGIYLPLDLRNPVFIDSMLTNEWTRPEYVELAVRQLEERQVALVLWASRLNSADDQTRPWEDHLEPMRRYLLSHYKRVHVFADGDEIWQRSEAR